MSRIPKGDWPEQILQKIRERSLFAVFTGDLVGSTGLLPEQLERVRDDLTDAAARLSDWEPEPASRTLEFFRGDAWQLLLSEPKWSLRSAVFLRASLLCRGVADTRIAIGIGTIDEISPGRLSLSAGEAFRLSGQALDKLTRRSRICMSLPREAGALGDWLPVVTRMCSAIMDRWTKRQAEVATWALKGMTQSEVGEQLHPPASQQSVAKTLAGADWHILELALMTFEDMDWPHSLRLPR